MRTNARPKALLAAYKEEPLYVDLRYARNEEDLSLANTEYKQRVVPVAAKLHGKTPADLASDEAREHERTVRIRNTVVVALTGLTLIACAAAWFAIDRAEVARNEAEAADRERRAAVLARKATERELLRAQGAELRAMIQRIRREEFDVARLVPEVAQPFWEGLVKSQPILKDDTTPAEVQTAVLSLFSSAL